MGSRNVNRTWVIPADVARRIKGACRRLQLWDSDLVCALLTHALDDLEAGRWMPRRRVAWYVIDGDQAAVERVDPDQGDGSNVA